MRYKLLGKSGLRVSEICLGAMTFGETGRWGSSKQESRRIFDAFVEAGGNFIDTANEYAVGASEEIVGELIASERERFVVATKYSLNMRRGDPNAGGNHRKNMVQSVEASLKRLKTDYIDLYWLHVWDFMTPVEEVMRAFDDLVRAGKVLYIGVSDAPAWIIAQANTIAELRGWTPFVGMQIEYSLIERTSERELLDMARAFDIGITSWSPLASGLLTGKYNRRSPVDSTETRRLDEVPFVQLTERNLTIAETVQRVAQELGCTAAQVALNWVWRQNIIPIIGVRTLDQLRDNLACTKITLGEEHLRMLDAVSRVDRGFPYDFLAQDFVQDVVYGGTFDLIDRHRP